MFRRWMPCIADVLQAMFWNLWRMHKRQDASRLPHVQAFRVKVHVGDITTAVERIGYVQQPREMTTYDMLRTCFHETVRNDIKGLQHALLAHDFNAISVRTALTFHPSTERTLQTLGLQCQLHFDNAHSPSRFIAVQNWLRRQYVLQGLQLIGADPVMGHAATQLTYWMTALEEALEQYYSWSDAQWSSDSDDDDMVSNSSDDTLTASVCTTKLQLRDEVTPRSPHPLPRLTFNLVLRIVLLTTLVRTRLCVGTALLMTSRGYRHYGQAGIVRCARPCRRCGVCLCWPRNLYELFPCATQGDWR